jgi:acetoin:2,6-dichlorophenolindophenol oxidoreductase subunit alpha
VNDELARTLYRRMLLARRFEERIAQVHREGRIPGALHLANGQEAVGVGACAALEPEDLIRTWVRGHHQVIGRGMPLRLICAELMGKATGSMRGRGGHQFLAWREGNLLGGCGIIGSVLPVAVGHALAQQLRGERAITVVFSGDGSATIGPTFEALNLAGLWRVPIVFVIEQNRYALSAPWSLQSAGEIAPRAEPFGVRGVVVDGNDVEAVHAAVGDARAAALDGQPTLIEAQTYRMAPFSTGDQGGYQPDEELAEWARRDPIERFGERIGLPYDEHERLCAELDAEIEDALAYADASPYPDPSDLFDGLLV